MPCDYGIGVILNVNEIAYQIPGIRSKARIAMNIGRSIVMFYGYSDLISINWIDPKRKLINSRYSERGRIAYWKSLFDSLAWILIPRFKFSNKFA